ncbi:MAG: hypothetical protein KF729_36900 [Sandaracinaceae bacterium]|nr:hypothetical protein [Sandaracinaceae bacterium]
MAPRFFEGPEKKVELSVVDGHPSLRALGAPFWRGVVAAARAEVLSTIANEHVDAHLLSESSLFVYDGLVTMITCGRTTLVDAVDAMLERIDPAAIAALVYERKSEHLPQEQPSSFSDDAARLRARLPGRSVRFGVGHEHAVRVFHTTREHRPAPTDRTLEILMHGIDPARADRFRGPPPAGGLAHRLGLERALAGHVVDEHFFAPAGYSFNALRGEAYTTLHVTPERLGSYAGFETNAPDLREHLPELVGEVVAAFAPDSFDVVGFEPGPAPVEVELAGYVLREHVRETISGYHVSFLRFSRDARDPVRASEIAR